MEMVIGIGDTVATTNLLCKSLDCLPTDCRQPGGGGTAAGNAAERRNLQQGGEHESAQVHARVRHAQSRAIDHPLIVEQQVEVCLLYTSRCV